MTSRPNVPAICPSASSIIRSPASLRRVPWGEFPDLIGTISRLRLLAPPRASLRLLRSALPPLRPLSLPRGRTIPRGPGPLLPRRPRRLSTVEKTRSQVPGRPLRTCPALRPRRTAAPQATTATPMVPSAFTTASAPPCANFGAPSRALHALCVRFEAGVTPGQRNTRFRLVASLGRAGLSPAGSHRWFTVMSFRLHGVLHHQALPGAT